MYRKTVAITAIICKSSLHYVISTNCISQVELDKPYTLVPLLGSIFLERIGSELH